MKKKVDATDAPRGYRAIKASSVSCVNCSFENQDCEDFENPCAKNERTDSQNVIFVPNIVNIRWKIPTAEDLCSSNYPHDYLIHKEEELLLCRNGIVDLLQSTRNPSKLRGIKVALVEFPRSVRLVKVGSHWSNPLTENSYPRAGVEKFLQFLFNTSEEINEIFVQVY